MKTVFVKYRDVAGNWSDSFSDEIVCSVPFTIVTESLPDGVFGIPYSYNLEASGGWPPYSWFKAGGYIPKRLLLDSLGVICGIPDSVGIFGFTIEAIDSAYNRKVSNLTISINEGVRGDVNGDNSVNILDVVKIVNIVLENMEPTSAQEWAADCNSDGIVNILDAVGIVNVVLGIGECVP